MTGAVLNLRKPPGITSHDVVDRVRGILRTRRTGHGGTLDPFAGGVLLVGILNGTKILPYLSELPKEYEAVLRLGEGTETFDTEKPVTVRAAVPDLERDAIARTLDSFRGTREQVPPPFSAVWVGGERAYEKARRGEPVVLPPRMVSVDEISLLSWDPPNLGFRALVSKGTYLRTLAGDIAAALGTRGHLTALTRTAVGPHRLSDSLTLDELEAAARDRRVETVALSLAGALASFPRVFLDEEGVRMVHNGISPEGHFSMPETPLENALVAAVGPDGRLAAILRNAPGRFGERFRFERVPD
jgi:tRNA pseudouridine55 synthase